MKKYWIISFSICLFFSIQTTSAQINQIPYFDKKGDVRSQSSELNLLADTISAVLHRADDVVWSRKVYRVIDMRDKQNYQLYFPIRPSETSRSLFRVMLDAICKGVSFYKKNPRILEPSFNDSLKLQGEDLSRVFAIDEEPDNNLIQIDPITKQRTIGGTKYVQYVKNQLKFLIYEDIFFDKHTSRLYSKIIGIAPLYALHPDNLESKESMKYFQGSILGWFAFDELRQELAKQNVISNGNETQRLTYDDFFSQQMYSSYLLGEVNMYNRMFLEYIADPIKIKKEQSRIETELLNFEQDIWEY